MDILFNEKPNISYSYDLEDHQVLMDQGYASQIENKNKTSVLLFKDVDDHIDGNGLSILWLIKGQGKFYHDFEATEMKTGDVLVFDDNVEHGFEANEFCMAVNITLDKEYSLDEVKSIIKNLNHPKKKMKP